MIPKLVNAQQVDGIWQIIHPILNPSLSHCDDLTMSGLYALCRSGQGFLFVTENLTAGLVGTFERAGASEAFRILALGSSENADWAEMMQIIGEFARANDAEKIVFQGRKGWQRALGIKPKTYNYEVIL